MPLDTWTIEHIRVIQRLEQLLVGRSSTDISGVPAIVSAFQDTSRVVLRIICSLLLLRGKDDDTGHPLSATNRIGLSPEFSLHVPNSDVGTWG